MRRIPTSNRAFFYQGKFALKIPAALQCKFCLNTTPCYCFTGTTLVMLLLTKSGQISQKRFFRSLFRKRNIKPKNSKEGKHITVMKRTWHILKQAFMERLGKRCHNIWRRRSRDISLLRSHHQRSIVTCMNRACIDTKFIRFPWLLCNRICMYIINQNSFPGKLGQRCL